MTELSFLLDLLLNEKLSVKVKTKLTERIKEIENLMVSQPTVRSTPSILQQMSAQAPSTQKILDEMAMHPVVVEPPQPSTAAAAQALQARANAMAQAGKIIPGTANARKF